MLNKSHDDNIPLQNAYSNYSNFSKGLNEQNKEVIKTVHRTEDKIKEENFYNSLSNFIPNQEDSNDNINNL